MRFWPTAIHMGMRIAIAAPLAPVIIVALVPPLTPLGFAMAMAIGAWTTKPLRRHPLFNVEGDAE